MKIAILGYGKQGQSAYTYWSKPGNDITIHDEHPINAPNGAKTKIGSDYLFDLQDYDLLVRTPGLHPKIIAEMNNAYPDILSKVTTVTNEFFDVCPAPIIGVTGTKGKGTTSSLVAAILKEAGINVHLGGNIGIPPLDLLTNNIRSTDWVVLELANYQTIDLHRSPHIAVCLMVAPEHLDWHDGMFEYLSAKQQLFKFQTNQNFAVYNSSNNYSEEIASVSKAKKLSYEVPPPGEEPFETNGAYVTGDQIFMGGYKICSTKDIKLLGRHNLENVCAAIAATWTVIGNQPEVYKKVFQSFTGLPHRLEVIGILNKVTYVNDSFGTTPETAIVAIESFQKPKVLIIGGASKNVEFHELAKAIAKSNIRHIIAIGDTGPEIAGLVKVINSKLEEITTILDKSVTMAQIVDAATQVAVEGDVILFSPACASFDMFKNYQDRGDQFKQVVSARLPVAK